MIGILFECYAIVNGDASKVNLQFLEKKPYAKLSLGKGFPSIKELDSQLIALTEYFEEIGDTFEERMPAIL
jgi:hypothetical protein